ncbi:MAG: hypothetical protein KBS86_02250 [Proteobacteria bacterium]|nr:hypothetical protein [Candidatus Enterousia scatequi]
MKKLLSPILFALLAMVFVLPAAYAVCPVCTVAVGAGLEGARLLGVEDVITGIWAGGLTLSMAGWTANYMRSRGVKGAFWYVLDFVLYYALLLMVYFIPSGRPIVLFGDKCMWGIDQFLLGIIVGSVVFFVMEVWYANIKKNNGGHAKFPFQKVVMPFGGLLVVTLIFWAIIKWLPQIGVTLC